MPFSLAMCSQAPGSERGGRGSLQIVEAGAGGTGTGPLTSSFPLSLAPDCVHPHLLPSAGTPPQSPPRKLPQTLRTPSSLRLAGVPQRNPKKTTLKESGPLQLRPHSVSPAGLLRENREGGGLALPGVSRGGVSLGRELMKS